MAMRTSDCNQKSEFSLKENKRSEFSLKENERKNKQTKNKQTGDDFDVYSNTSFGQIGCWHTIRTRGIKETYSVVWLFVSGIASG